MVYAACCLSKYHKGCGEALASWLRSGASSTTEQRLWARYRAAALSAVSISLQQEPRSEGRQHESLGWFASRMQEAAKDVGPHPHKRYQKVTVAAATTGNLPLLLHSLTSAAG